jgi:hypothetical protein
MQGKGAGTLTSTVQHFLGHQPQKQTGRQSGGRIIVSNLISRWQAPPSASEEREAELDYAVVGTLSIIGTTSELTLVKNVEVRGLLGTASARQSSATLKGGFLLRDI